MYWELTKSTTSYATILFSAVKLLMFFAPNNWLILLITSIIEKSNSISIVGYLSAKLDKSEIIFQKTRYFFDKSFKRFKDSLFSISGIIYLLTHNLKHL